MVRDGRGMVFVRTMSRNCFQSLFNSTEIIVCFHKMYRGNYEWVDEKGEIIICEECNKMKAIRRESTRTAKKWWYLCSDCFINL